MSEDRRRAEVLRLLDRYLVEIVEAYGLCPWARSAREGDELAADVVWGTPPIEAWVTTAERLLARPSARVVMVVAPELAVTPADLRSIRDAVAARIPSAGIAEFHPEAQLDLASPGRLVRFVRRSPDPLLQLVPLSLLESVRAASPAVDRVEQAQLLGGHPTVRRTDAADKIAITNHATVSAEHVEITRLLDDITEDRRRSYARVGIHGSH